MHAETFVLSHALGESTLMHVYKYGGICGTARMKVPITLPILLISTWTTYISMHK